MTGLPPSGAGSAVRTEPSAALCCQSTVRRSTRKGLPEGRRRRTGARTRPLALLAAVALTLAGAQAAWAEEVTPGYRLEARFLSQLLRLATEVRGGRS